MTILLLPPECKGLTQRSENPTEREREKIGLPLFSCCLSNFVEETAWRGLASSATCPFTHKNMQTHKESNIGTICYNLLPQFHVFFLQIHFVPNFWRSWSLLIWANASPSKPLPNPCFHTFLCCSPDEGNVFWCVLHFSFGFVLSFPSHGYCRHLRQWVSNVSTLAIRDGEKSRERFDMLWYKGIEWNWYLANPFDPLYRGIAKGGSRPMHHQEQCTAKKGIVLFWN